MVLVIIIITFIIVLYVALNVLYKRTNHYKNSLLPYPTFVGDVPTDIKFAVFGSTYAQYAFGNIQQMGFNKAYCFALPCESSEADLVKLKRLSNKLSPECVVAITLAPCNTLYHWGQLNEGIKHYGYMSMKEKKDWKVLSFIQYHLPLFPFNIRNAGKIVKDTKYQKSIYDMVAPRFYSKEQVAKNAQKMADIWIKLFGLKNLKEPVSNPVNTSDIKKNSTIIVQMIDYCQEHGFRPIIVVPPFSKKLNDYFAADFIQSTLGKVFEMATQKGVHIYDLREDEYFQDNAGLYTDGVFLLNQYGSERFIKRLFSKMNDEGLALNNGTLKS